MSSSSDPQTSLPFKGDLQKDNSGWGKSFSNLVYRLSALLIRFILRINGGLEIIGIENIPPTGGVIIASNHSSYLDPPLIGAVIPRRATFLARKGLFTIPLLGSFIKYFAVPVDREKTRTSTIKSAVKRLRNGELLIIFPEGRRSETGELQKGKRGVGMIAGLSKAIIVPALISGSDRALPVGARWPRRARISIVFDNPLSPSTLYVDKNSSNEEITRKIMSSIGEIKKRYADNRG